MAEIIYESTFTFHQTPEEMTESYQEFLASDKRLFNRRGSDESTSGSSDVQPKTDLNVNAAEFIPSLASPISKTGQRRSKRSLRKGSKRCCQYCLKKGFDAAQYGSHSMRHPRNQQLICPILLSNL